MGRFQVNSFSANIIGTKTHIWESYICDYIELQVFFLQKTYDDPPQLISYE